MKYMWLMVGIGIGLVVLLLILLIRYLEQRFRDISQQALSSNIDAVIKIAEDRLSLKGKETEEKLASERRLINQTVGQIEKLLRQTQTELVELSKQTSTQFGSLRQSLEEHRRLTGDLKASTDELKRLLSNNQRLGSWGERIAEDILQAAGLQKGIHYEVQQSGVNGRPDIVFKLPDNKVVNVDVKFPFKHLQAWLQTEDPEEKKRYLQKFREEVRNKIREIKSRGYINPQEGTLDYAVMFIPNEMVFGFINERLGEVIDEAMANKIILASPFTFYAVARIIFESYRNFYYEKNLRQIVKLIGDFSHQWQLFKGEFEGLNDLFKKVDERLDKIRTVRYKRMERKISQIEEYKHKQLSPGDAKN